MPKCKLRLSDQNALQNNKLERDPLTHFSPQHGVRRY